MVFVMPFPLWASSLCHTPGDAWPGTGRSDTWHPEQNTRCFRPGSSKPVNKAALRYGEIFARLDVDQEYFQPLLELARHSDTRFCLEDRADGTRGYFDYRFNLIAVRETLDLEQQAAIVLHELRHLSHVHKGYRLTLEYAREEMVRMTFAVEADVQAFLALFAWRLRSAGDDRLWRTLLGFRRYADIAIRFQRVLEQSGDELVAARAAFDQWYRSDWRVTGYFRGCTTGYLDLLKETRMVERYDKLPENFFDRLCELPDGRNYRCQESDQIRATRRYPPAAPGSDGSRGDTVRRRWPAPAPSDTP